MSTARESMTKAAKSECSHGIVSDIAQQSSAQTTLTKASSSSFCTCSVCSRSKAASADRALFW
eukprot:CAMPEP_0183415094 /NCGR_PEP_ID=MMETSP0370-20130417/22849_1 /TAXON_ID=268820 /ORGANISM="Peridinium aciculiferum, Strain PAER-2" /LENGTH=62 /DNA_ID=CAMNT_0025598479 /DNA_START=43 /DNA_END=228 /DNA_ORIENTATION=+